MPHTNTTRAWYALRRTLPVWSFEENLCELIDVLPRYGVDEVIVKVDTEEFTHGQPPLDWVREYQANLFRIRDELRRIDIRYSVNPWITMGHNDRGRDARKQLPGLRTMVGHDGAVCTCSACPLSDAWRKNTAAVWTLYAETEPEVIWVEDDIRTFNHKPVDYGCFCDEHMRLFSERVARPVAREELVAALLRPGEPHPWRARFLDMQAEIMIETVGFLAQTVHRSSPETSLGLMSSGPRTHCLEGRRWAGFAEALADGRPLYSRPPMGNYSEGSLRGLYYSHDSMKITRSCLPSDTIEQTEVENVPFTQFSKSVTFTFLEMAVSFAYGSPGVTMNLYDHCGTPLEREPGYGRMLGERKRYFDGLVGRTCRPGAYRGVLLLHHERESYHKRLSPGNGYPALAGDGSPTMQMLESHGIPTTYEESGETVAAASGQQLRAFSDDRIRELLAGGLLLDGVAAGVLFERGFGPEIGLVSIGPPRCIDELGAHAAEELHNPDFAGAEKKFLTLTIPSLGGRPDIHPVDLSPGTIEISCLVDPDARRGLPCMYAFENELGGRVVVHLFDLASAYGIAFNHPFRADQLQAVVSWLSRGRPSVLVRGSGAYPLAFRKDCEGFTVLGLFNLTLDPWPSAELVLTDRREIERLEVLTADGRWSESGAISVRREDERTVVRYGSRIPHDEPLFITVWWKK